ncbi:hypothetical protein ACFU8W_51055 [Streptomyces sp. NPDC057565]|uniref:hypothetical protein n=1 Tax=Streptomyces sp. NPDC057565 TaxID=3346169 RepID=UPI0036793CFA
MRTSRARTSAVTHFGSVRTLLRTRQFFRCAKPCSTGTRTAASALFRQLLAPGQGLVVEIDASGKIYVAWQDRRFRINCSSNDIVYSTSTNGTTWSAVTRVPIGATSSTVDHFIPGLGVDHATSGSTAKLGLYYYFYPNSSCTASTCQLEVGFTSSTDGDATWSAAQTVAGPMSLSQIASTTQGSMVGNYMSTSVVNGKSVAIFAVGQTPTNGQAFDEGMYIAGGGLAVLAGTVATQADPVVYTAHTANGNASFYRNAN